jgi:hypothetical protein
LNILVEYIYNPLRWVYTPGATAMRRICDVAFNITIPSQRQRTSSLTIARENFRTIEFDHLDLPDEYTFPAKHRRKKG